MKAELMVLALLFAALSFISSHASLGSHAILGSDGQTGQIMGALTGNGYQLWLDPFWQPSREVQILLFGLQAVIALVIFAYFVRPRKEEKSTEPDWE
jgi:cobalt transport protein